MKNLKFTAYHATHIEATKIYKKGKRQMIILLNNAFGIGDGCVVSQNYKKIAHLYSTHDE